MNNNYKEKEITAIYNKTPKDIRKMLLNENFGPVIYVIGKDHGLTALQSLDVEDEVADVLLGIKKQKDLAQNIAIVLRTTEGIARKIVEDIDENIFSEVRDSLAKINNENTNKIIIKTDKTENTITKIPTITNEERRKIAVNELTKPLLPKVPQPMKQSTREASNTQVSLKDTSGIGEKNIPDIPSTEHLFEKKLRGAFNTTDDKKEESQPIAQATKIDPYRESLK